jgi:translation initiation factor 5B
MEVKMI